MSKKRLLYIGFFVVLALSFYFILTLVIPGFGKKKVEPISFVKPFSFLSQDGRAITNKDVDGKVYVVDYFFTTCPTICPIMHNSMKKVYDAFKDEKDFLILSHTCDPDVDSVAQLKKFADSMGVDTRRWMFLTGRKDSLYNMARVSYTIDDPNDHLVDIDDDFMHTQLWALVDKKGYVRKIYDSLKESEIRELLKDAQELLKE